jgi:two-component system response regulator HydG
MAQLLDHAWPGNVRELDHAIERVVLLGRSTEAHATDLPPTISSAPPPGMPGVLQGDVLPIREVQRRYAAWALERFAGHKARTAEALGVDVKTLSKWLASADE